MYAKQCKFTIKDIAKWTGLSLDTVHRHNRAGWFDMDDPFKTITYIFAHSCLNLLTPERDDRR